MIPISSGGKGTREFEGEEDGDHHRRRREDDPARMRDPVHFRVLRVATDLVVFPRTRQEEDRVVHGDRKDHGVEEHRNPRVEETLWREAEQVVIVTVLKDQAGNTEGPPGRQQTGEDADCGDEQGPQREDQEHETQQQDEPDHHRGL